MFERYTERARRALFYARYESAQLGSTTIETEHLLLGIARAREPLAEQLLSPARLSFDEIRRQIESRRPHKDVTVTPDWVEIPFTDDTKHVFEYAAEESDRLLHTHIGSEHLLLGLLRHEQGLAWDILKERGLALAAVRDALVLHVSASSPPPPEIAEMLAAMRGIRREPVSGPIYILTSVDGPSPGRRVTADDAGFSGGFFSTVGFSTPADQPPDGRIHSIGPISMSGTTLSAFAQLLENFLGRPVLDETEITGTCDIELQGEYDNPEALIAALRDQLGLVLTASLP